MSQRSAGLALVIGGALAMVAGVVWLAADGGGDERPTGVGDLTTTTAEATTTTVASTTTTTPSTSTTVAPPAETPEVFYGRWAAALAGGDAEFLFERLHPSVLERYDEALCQQYLGGLDAPAAAAEVLSVGETATWRWETDGLVRDIPGATTVRVRRTEDGDTFIENDTHVVIGADGLVRWFTDCGTPKEGAA